MIKSPLIFREIQLCMSCLESCLGSFLSLVVLSRLQIYLYEGRNRHRLIHKYHIACFSDTEVLFYAILIEKYRFGFGKNLKAKNLKTRSYIHRLLALSESGG